MQEYLRLIREFPSGRRTDVTPLFSNPQAFAALVDDLVAPYATDSIDLVAGVDALGFILGTAIAIRLKLGFTPIRKAGKLPSDTLSAQALDYSGQRKGLELAKDAVAVGSRVLLVDEWVETGAQVSAAIALLESAGGIVAGICAVNVDQNARTQALRLAYKVHSVMPKNAA